MQEDKQRIKQQEEYKNLNILMQEPLMINRSSRTIRPLIQLMLHHLQLIIINKGIPLLTLLMRFNRIRSNRTIKRITIINKIIRLLEVSVQLQKLKVYSLMTVEY